MINLEECSPFNPIGIRESQEVSFEITIWINSEARFYFDIIVNCKLIQLRYSFKLPIQKSEILNLHCDFANSSVLFELNIIHPQPMV